MEANFAAEVVVPDGVCVHSLYERACSDALLFEAAPLFNFVFESDVVEGCEDGVAVVEPNVHNESFLFDALFCKDWFDL